MGLSVLNNSEDNTNVVKVCNGHMCGSREADDIYDALQNKYKGSETKVIFCPCTGHCDDSNNVYVGDEILHWQTPKRVVDQVDRKLYMQRRAREDAEGPISSSDADDLLGL